MKILISFASIILLLSVSSAAYAQEGSSDQITLKENLDRILDNGQGQELALRMVKFGLEIIPGKIDRERQQRFICNHAAFRGSNFDHVFCRENEVLSYLEDAGVLDADPQLKAWDRIFPLRRVGIEYVTGDPVSPAALETAMETLGPNSFNRKLVLAVFQGKPLPDDSPSMDELNRFAEALAAVNTIQSEYAPRIRAAGNDERVQLLAESDNSMVKVIQNAGFGVKDYNEISLMVEQYPALRAYVRDQM